MESTVVKVSEPDNREEMIPDPNRILILLIQKFLRLEIYLKNRVCAFSTGKETYGSKDKPVFCFGKKMGKEITGKADHFPVFLIGKVFSSGQE